MPRQTLTCKSVEELRQHQRLHEDGYDARWISGYESVKRANGGNSYQCSCDHGNMEKFTNFLQGRVALFVWMNLKSWLFYSSINRLKVGPTRGGKFV